jgi:hypothetical protein
VSAAEQAEKMERSVVAATNAADATLKLANVAVDTQTKLERPYLFPIIVGLDFGEKEQPALPLMVHYRYRNFGRSPAIVNRTVSNFNALKNDAPQGDLDETATWVRGKTDIMAVRILVAGEGTPVHENAVIGPPRYDDGSQPPVRETLVHMYTEMEYADFLGNRHREWARHIYSPYFGYFVVHSHGELPEAD